MSTDPASIAGGGSVAPERFVTLFDSGFLPQALALIGSLRRAYPSGGFRLHCLTLDDAAAQVLARLEMAEVSILPLAAYETDALRAVKPTRSRAEYCWTLTPSAFDFAFEADPDAARMTYLDADLWFARRPAPLFDEMERAGKSVLITEHAYAPEYDHSAISGRFCVQFVTIGADGAARAVQREWREQCLEWCYARPEIGRFGDQMYLDAWPEEHRSVVHVLENWRLTAAPWNAKRLTAGELDDIVLYHFHGLRLAPGRRVLANQLYDLGMALERIYLRYLDDLAEARRVLVGQGCEWPVQAPTPRLSRRLKLAWKRLQGKDRRDFINLPKARA